MTAFETGAADARQAELSATALGSALGGAETDITFTLEDDGPVQQEYMAGVRSVLGERAQFRIERPA